MATNPATQQALANFKSLPNEAQTRLPVVAALYGCSQATVWRRVKSGHIPKPRKIGQRTTCWQVGELRAHLAGAVA
jgi:predicted DNA-binding transcriptional regulator AlpA